MQYFVPEAATGNLPSTSRQSRETFRYCAKTNHDSELTAHRGRSYFVGPRGAPPWRSKSRKERTGKLAPTGTEIGNQDACVNGTQGTATFSFDGASAPSEPPQRLRLKRHVGEASVSTTPPAGLRSQRHCPRGFGPDDNRWGFDPNGRHDFGRGNWTSFGSDSVLLARRLRTGCGFRSKPCERHAAKGIDRASVLSNTGATGGYRGFPRQRAPARRREPQGLTPFAASQRQPQFTQVS